jgi:hypothetical protein
MIPVLICLFVIGTIALVQIVSIMIFLELDRRS